LFRNRDVVYYIYKFFMIKIMDDFVEAICQEWQGLALRRLYTTLFSEELKDEGLSMTNPIVLERKRDGSFYQNPIEVIEPSL